MSSFAAELRKLHTVPTTWIVSVVGWALVLISASLPFLVDVLGNDFDGSASQVASTIDQIGTNSVIPLVVGVLVITTEFRHGTIGRTLQLVPSRLKVLGWKLAAGGAYAILFTLVSLVLVAAMLWIMAAVEGVSLGWGPEGWTALWQVFVGMILPALLGVAVGALVRSQVMAITLVLVWVFVAESLIMLKPAVGKWMPFQALNSVFMTAETRAAMGPNAQFLEPGVALAAFVGYVVVFTALAVLLMRKRDV